MLHILSRRNMFREFDAMCILTRDRFDLSRSYSVTDIHLEREHYRRLAGITGVPKSTISRVLCQESQLHEESVKLDGLSKKLGRNDFKATDGWLSRWKERYNIKLKKGHGEKGKIFCADETGLYYRAKPNNSLCCKHIALSGYKKAMDRITVLCCTNMSGTEKRKRLII
ncbi:hypothetical protein RF11_09576 [Thelohanellus kitauei]|uniref:HTH CENPB-type domain-containing protein n=1 Tax=Thelohanellus kitauei TaxID=669202 RepID=A0A0C2MD79_THEKT|nr:hypothetical protein RF11_09576 [Thelohanellus kitauei]